MEIVLSASLSHAASSPIFVDVSVSGGNNDGSSWANAYNSFQSALNSAGSGNQIWVAKGTYKPSYDYGLGGGSRYYHFRMIGGVAIYGGFAGTEDFETFNLDNRDFETNETILSGDLNGDDNYSGSPWTGTSENCYHVFYHPNGLALTSNAILDGFTIMGGNANATNPHNSGGGLYNVSNSPTINNCIFIHNYGKNGGGIRNYNCSSIINNCTFNENSATDGGGVFNSVNSSASFINCTFSSNKAQTGAGAENSNSSATFSSCNFQLNVATDFGGGVQNENSGSPNFINSIFQHNSANGGGGVSNDYSSSASYTNCLISDNEATLAGGGILNTSTGTINIINCTITANQASQGGGIVNNSATVYLKNCIIWGNTASQASQIGNSNSVVLIYNSCFTEMVTDPDHPGSVTEVNNITSNPQFVGASNNPAHPYSIGGISPCCDTGNDDFNSQSYDIRGEGFTRKLDKTDGGAGIIDMGAYEYKVGTDASLPVELTNFTAKCKSGVVILRWTTESEIENLGFIVEKISKSNCSGVIREWQQVASYLTDKMLVGQGSTTEKHDYQFTDKAVQPGASYIYRIADVNYSGRMTWHSGVEVKVDEINVIIPEKIGLQAVYPNPFNPVLTICYGLADDAQMTLQVYNLSGKLVETLISTYKLKGTYTYTWQPVNLSAGMYIVRMQSGDQKSLQKVVFVK